MSPSPLIPPAYPAPAPDTAATGLPVCRSEELAERGQAVLWDVRLYRQPARAFALRVDGKVVAYINRCAHVPTEMDWQSGEFWDMDRRNILCSIHGASYEPKEGRCVGGPCGKGRLLAVAIQEQGGQVSWYPSRDIQPLPFEDPATPPAAPSGVPLKPSP
jgi:nitrite reductase/ring-hydroxylating ferredoxin subunit